MIVSSLDSLVHVPTESIMSGFKRLPMAYFTIN